MEKALAEVLESAMSADKSGQIKNRTRLFADDIPEALDDEQEKLKREIYERMNPRRRKFVDRLGYENWNPFQKPNDPLDLRTDSTKRTIQQLMADFLRTAPAEPALGKDYLKGVAECALGIVKKDDKYQGIFDFCLWYHDLLKKEEKK